MAQKKTDVAAPPRARLELEFEQPHLLGPLFGEFDRNLVAIEDRLGVYIAMTHVLLPFLVLPLYGVMKGISSVEMRARSGTRTTGRTPGCGSKRSTSRMDAPVRSDRFSTTLSPMS